jgi:hypothetical protein
MDTLVGYTVGFYALAAMFMYGTMLTAAFRYGAFSDNEIPEEISDNTGRILTKATADTAWGVTFAVSHVVAFALIATAATGAYLDVYSPGVASGSGMLHTGSIIWAWLIAGSFAGAAVIAWGMAEVANSVTARLMVTVYTAVLALSAYIIRRRGWLIDERELAGQAVGVGLVLVGAVALLLAGVGMFTAVVFALAVLLVIGVAMKSRRAHLDALQLKSTAEGTD